MESKMIILVYLTVFVFVYGYNNNNNCPVKCFCGREIVTCDGAVNPTFELDWRVETFLIQRSYLNNLKDIMNSLRNLKYLTIKDMKSFNCSQLMYVPSSVLIDANACEITTNQVGGKENKFPYCN